MGTNLSRDATMRRLNKEVSYSGLLKALKYFGSGEEKTTNGIQEGSRDQVIVTNPAHQ